MKLQQCSEDVVLEKYAKEKEQQLSGDQAIDAIRKRVAHALAKPEKQSQEFAQQFYDAQKSGLIMAGRINSAAGTGIDATLINCFVQPVADSVSGYEDGRPGIYTALSQATETMRRGGGEGYNFSYIRPRGAKVKGTNSTASGPVSYMSVFSASCKTVESAGSRRGAQMGVLRIDHPDIREFITEKRKAGSLTQFNISVLITDVFMECRRTNESFDLVHKAEPDDALIEKGAYRRDDDMWVYETVDPEEIWDLVMKNTYDQADPGCLFVDTINNENNLYYAEYLEATNPCGEVPLPDYGCCDLGSLNLCAYVIDPFSNELPKENFDWARFKQDIHSGIRMLDNVLNVTFWPLEEQRKEANAKRRVGLGLTGLGSTLVMLNLRYDKNDGRDFAEIISEILRDESYRASIELAKQKGAFPLFEKEKYLKSKFVQRLPEDIQKGIEEHGIRNSHVLSIAPCGTISIAYADNCSSGIEPSFAWTYIRKKRMSDGSKKDYEVMDHAYRVYIEKGGDAETLPSSFVTALEITPEDHLAMVAVFAKNIDAAISKTINVPVDIKYEDFKNIYIKAHKLGLKGVTTFRPNMITGSVLSTESEKPSDLDTSADRKIRLDVMPKPALESLRWPKRPVCPDGNPSMTYMVEHQDASFAVFVGHLGNGNKRPFELWVQGEKSPRGLNALAKSLSMDMRSEDFGWLKSKLGVLEKTSGKAFNLEFPGSKKPIVVASDVAAMAKLVEHRCSELGIFQDITETPLLDAMFAEKEPKSGTDGTLSWTVDIQNPATGDDFALFIKELVLPDHSCRPYSMWMSGEYPEGFKGLCKSLSLDMRIIDPAWIAKKLRSLSNFPEAQGDFLAKMPGSKKMVNQPSTIAYIARLIIHRYKMLGILDSEGYPVNDMGLFQTSVDSGKPSSAPLIMAGKKCSECGVHAVIKKDGCDFCTACGEIGSCG